MRLINLFLVACFIIFFSCKKESVYIEKSSDFKCSNYPYTGKLVLKGLCLNYTIEFIDPKDNTNLIESIWTDNELSGKSYKNVFRLASICTFPSNIEEGDKFSFDIISDYQDSCINCKAYSPTPDKALFIDVCK
tara:strand:- start:566 stop:967 length:402 start_codon:yes stop_codon:yes gene_type:complete